MSTLPLIIQGGALPPAMAYTPQQLFDAMVARMSIVTAGTYALFVAGSTEPSSNVGPWLKDNQEWYVWSDSLGQYVPQSINQGTLGYAISNTAPDHTIYQFWIETTSLGSPLAIKIWYGGAWVDVYAAQLASYQTVAAMAAYSTTAAMTAAIAAAVVALPFGQGMFKARPTVPQDLIFAMGETQSGIVTLGTVDFDPDGEFATDKFTCVTAGYYQFNGAMQAQLTAGSPSVAEANCFFAVNGTNEDQLSDESINSSGGVRIVVGSTVLLLAAGDYVELHYEVTLDAAGTMQLQANETRLSGYRVR